ncbi:LysR family transcriptional regulator [Plasticicumulans acidivorans]|uniref:LysR family transcriptional regulator n=1 Tax=Plasticicumulans acidivorans TaxID=886464 RepID=A0A317MVB6_9GAMM|nr:LysR family transcriptional regulator [Plasticicumulans acidivorans]PWV61071.1 LysR family transcriptional regulator [Plasticicumulans acidivorans]
MDSQLLRTFLEVARTRHFGRAAGNLYLTQSAVSARIRQLEEAVGAALLERNRREVRLTAAGERFARHAAQLLVAWTRACEDVQRGEDAVSIGCGAPAGLWERPLGDWLARLSLYYGQLALNAEAQSAEVVLRRLGEGALDLAFVCEPPTLDGCTLREVARCRLRLVSTRADCTPPEALGEGFVLIDWGVSLQAELRRHFAEMPTPRLRVATGRQALYHLRQCGGAAYVEETLAARGCGEGGLYEVAGAPVLERQVYAVYAFANARIVLLEQMLGEF